MTSCEAPLIIEPHYTDEIVPAVMPEKVVFLDIDGVLNNWAHLGAIEHGTRGIWTNHFDPACVARLNQITRRTGAKIVLSSSWRMAHRPPEMRAILRAVGVEAEVVAFTPAQKFSDTRYGEVARWLMEADYHGLYAILDDSVRDYEGDFVVHTTMNEGLTDEHVEMACRFLTVTSP